MAHVVERFRCFTCTPLHISTNCMNHAFTIPARTALADPGWMECWVSLGTTMVDKQSAQDCYMTENAAVGCSSHHASLGDCSAVAMSVELTTSQAARHDANCWATDKRTLKLRTRQTAKTLTWNWTVHLLSLAEDRWWYVHYRQMTSGPVGYEIVRPELQCH